MRILGSVPSDEELGLRSILILDNNENVVQLFEVFPRGVMADVPGQSVVRDKA